MATKRKSDAPDDPRQGFAGAIGQESSADGGPRSVPVGGEERFIRSRTNGPICTKQRCTNPVWFTKEQLCRQHGIAEHLDDPNWVAPTAKAEPDTGKESKPEEA